MSRFRDAMRFLLRFCFLVKLPPCVILTSYHVGGLVTVEPLPAVLLYLFFYRKIDLDNLEVMFFCKRIQEFH